jgi:hypothetical protein
MTPLVYNETEKLFIIYLWLSIRFSDTATMGTAGILAVVLLQGPPDHNRMHQ